MKDNQGVFSQLAVETFRIPSKVYHLGKEIVHATNQDKNI